MTDRVRPALRRVAIVAFVILLPAMAHSFWDYVEIQRLVGEIERIREKREPVSNQEAIGRRDPPPEEPSAGLYYSAAGMLALAQAPYRVNSDVGEWLARSPHAQQLPEQLETSLHALVLESRDALLLADKAATLPFTGFPGGTDYSYRSAGIGNLYELVATRSLSLSVSGNADAALDSAITGLRIRRALREGHFWSAGGSEVAAVLSLARPSPGALLRMQAALEAEEQPELPLASFLRERARFIETVWRRYYGNSPNAPERYTLPMRSVTERISRPWLTHGTVETLRLWADLVDVVRMPWPERAQVSGRTLTRLENDQNSRSRLHFNVFGGADIAVASFARAVDPTPLIIDRCSLVAIALERFRRDRGSVPATLPDLVPRYMAAVPIDPFSGKPLLFRVSADAYTIYSVGYNGQDDRGDLTSQLEDPGPRNRRGMGADVGIRVLPLH